MGFSLQGLLVLLQRGSRACRLQELWCTGFGALRHVESSVTRGQTHVPCLDGKILNHGTTREIQCKSFWGSTGRQAWAWCFLIHSRLHMFAQPSWSHLTEEWLLSLHSVAEVQMGLPKAEPAPWPLCPSLTPGCCCFFVLPLSYAAGPWASVSCSSWADSLQGERGPGPTLKSTFLSLVHRGPGPTSRSVKTTCAQIGLWWLSCQSGRRLSSETSSRTSRIHPTDSVVQLWGQKNLTWGLFVGSRPGCVTEE